MTLRWWVLCALLAVISTAGCGKSNPQGRLPISGEVSLKGQPLDRGSIELTPLDPAAKVIGGTTIQDGKFALAADRGLPPGKYRVRIYSAGSAAGGAGEMPGDSRAAVAAERIPAGFNTDSKQEVEVTSAGPNKFDFKIP